MPANEIRLQLVIEAFNRADAAFKDLNRRLKEAQDGTADLHAKSQKLDAGIASLATRYLGLAAAIGGVTLAAKQAISFLAQIETASCRRHARPSSWAIRDCRPLGRRRHEYGLPGD